MISQLDLATHTTLAAVRQFMEARPPEAARVPSRAEAYAYVGRTLRRFAYWKLGKADKGLLRAYLQRTTGLSRAQVARLIAAIPAAVHAGGHLAAGGDRRAAQHAVGTGHDGPAAAR